MNRKSITKDLVYIAIFVALMVVFTLYVSIPFYPVPLTFQTVICVLAGLLLGAVRGSIAMLVYVFMGFVLSLPVFAGGKGGFSMVFSPTFGYIIGFPVASFVAGIIRGKSENAKLPRYLIAALAACLACYVVGIPYFLLVWRYYLGNLNVWHAAVTYNLLYIPKDAVLCFVAAIIAFKVAPFLFKSKNDKDTKNAANADNPENNPAADDKNAKQS